MNIILFILLIIQPPLIFFLFFFNDTATTEIYTLSLHDALPISVALLPLEQKVGNGIFDFRLRQLQGVTEARAQIKVKRSEEHTSELQSPCNLVCRLLLEKKKKKTNISTISLIKKSYNDKSMIDT